MLGHATACACHFETQSDAGSAHSRKCGLRHWNETAATLCHSATDCKNTKEERKINRGTLVVSFCIHHLITFDFRFAEHVLSLTCQSTVLAFAESAEIAFFFLSFSAFSSAVTRPHHLLLFQSQKHRMFCPPTSIRQIFNESLFKQRMHSRKNYSRQSRAIANDKFKQNNKNELLG